MDLKRLRYFCSVVDNGSFTRASRILHIAQPPLSRRIQELEKELGVPLLIRDGRQVRPTPAGYVLHARAKEIFHQISAAVDETLEVAKAKRALLRIGLTHLYQRYFSRLLLDLHRRYGDIEISIKVSDSAHLEELLSTGHIDVALIQKPQETLRFNMLEFQPVPLVAVVSNQMFVGESEMLTPEDIKDCPLVMLRRSEGIGTYEVLLHHFRSRGLEPSIMMSISQPEVILEWMQSGLEAVALIPQSEVNTATVQNCRVMPIRPMPLVFFPTITTLSGDPLPAEILQVLKFHDTMK